MSSLANDHSNTHEKERKNQHREAKRPRSKRQEVRSVKRASPSPGTSQAGKGGACAEGRAGVPLVPGRSWMPVSGWLSLKAREEKGQKLGFAAVRGPFRGFLQVMGADGATRLPHNLQDPRLRSSHPASSGRRRAPPHSPGRGVRLC